MVAGVLALVSRALALVSCSCQEAIALVSSALALVSRAPSLVSRALALVKRALALVSGTLAFVSRTLALLNSTRGLVNSSLALVCSFLALASGWEYMNVRPLQSEIWCNHVPAKVANIDVSLFKNKPTGKILGIPGIRGDSREVRGLLRFRPTFAHALGARITVIYKTPD